MDEEEFLVADDDAILELDALVLEGLGAKKDAAVIALGFILFLLLLLLRPAVVVVDEFDLGGMEEEAFVFVVS